MTARPPSKTCPNPKHSPRMPWKNSKRRLLTFAVFYLNWVMRWAMSDLPIGWVKTTFGEVTEIIGGGTPSSKVSSNFTKEGGTPWITPSDLSGYKEIYISHGARNLTDRGLRES